MAERRVSDGSAAQCEILARCRDGEHDGGSLAIIYDRSSNRCACVSWRPGARPDVSSTDLDRALPTEILDAAVAGRRLVVTDADEGVFGVDLGRGSVARLCTTDGAAALSPCGCWLLEATDSGLRFLGLETNEDNALAAVGRPVVVLERELDNPCTMAVVPGPTVDDFDVAIGCYGYVDLVSVAMAGRTHAAAPAAQARTCRGGKLPYDPVFVVSASTGPFVYAMSEAGSALAAIDLRSGEFLDYPNGVTAYGAFRRVVPCLGSTACLIETGTGDTVRWRRGLTVEPLVPVAGRVVLWEDDRALVLDRETAVVREEALRAQP